MGHILFFETSDTIVLYKEVVSLVSSLDLSVVSSYSTMKE